MMPFVFIDVSASNSLFRQQSAPGVQRVIHNQTVLQHFMVIGKVARQSIRNREQSLALRGEIGPRRISPSDNGRQMVKCLIVDVVNTYDRVKGAAVCNVTKLGIFDVVRRTAYVLGHLGDLVGWNVDEFSIGVDKPAYQPRTCNTINFGMLARDPFVFRHAALSSRWEMLLFPCGDSPLKIGSLESRLTQSCSRTLAHFVSAHAISNDRTIVR